VIEAPLPFGVSAPPLSEQRLAQIGLATIYEARAKSDLSLVLKSLAGQSYDEWVACEKRQFKDIVDQIDDLIPPNDSLRDYFDIIKKRHEDWRDSRNFVVHTVWAQSSHGRARAYCRRRQRLGDENDIVRAVNDTFWLAGHAHQLAFQIALKIEAGEISEGGDDAKASMRAKSKSVRF
jgi:hypothetical protein